MNGRSTRLLSIMIENDRLRIVPFMTTPEKRIVAMETDPSGPAVT
jgi:hypothetical protein